MAEGGRLYVKSTPATRGEVPVEEAGASSEAGGVEGAFYRQPADPVEQASAQAGDPPDKGEIQSARRADKAADKSGDHQVTDPAAETVQDEPVEAASEQAGDPPVETTNPPAGNATRAEWVDYAVNQQGATEEELDGLGRNEIRDRYLP
jgi:hypothetical protein